MRCSDKMTADNPIPILCLCRPSSIAEHLAADMGLLLAAGSRLQTPNVCSRHNKRHRRTEFTVVIWGTADMNGRTALASSVEFDPKRSLAGQFCCDAQRGSHLTIW